MRQADLWGKMLTRDHYEAVAALVRRPSGSLTLPGGVIVKRHDGLFIIWKDTTTRINVALRIPGQLRSAGMAESRPKPWQAD